MPRSLICRGHFNTFAKTGGGAVMPAAAVALALLLRVSMAAAQTTSPSTAPVSSASSPTIASNPSTTAPSTTARSTTAAAPVPAPASVPAPPAGAPVQSSSTQADTANSPSGESAQPSIASPSPEQQAQADAAVLQGQTAYAAGDYTTAETFFRQALALAPSAAAQYGLAMALDLQGKPTEAFVALEELLNMPGHTELSAEQVAAATQRHTVLKTIPASIVVQVVSATAPGPEKPAQPLSDVQLTVNGAEQAGLPPFTLKLPAGEHNLAVTAPGYEPQSLTVTVRPAESVEETFLLDPVAQPAAVAPAAPPEVEDTAPSVPLASNRTPGFVTLGVAGAAAVVGTVFGVQALGAKDKFEDDPTVAHADDVERNALIADMAFGIAFTLGITGVVLLLADEPPTQSATSTSTDTALRVVPFFSRESGGAAAHLTF